MVVRCRTEWSSVSFNSWFGIGIIVGLYPQPPPSIARTFFPTIMPRTALVAHLFPPCGQNQLVGNINLLYLCSLSIARVTHRLLTKPMVPSLLLRFIPVQKIALGDSTEAAALDEMKGKKEEGKKGKGRFVVRVTTGKEKNNKMVS